MRAKAQMWGNSLAVRIPKAIADEAGIREREEIEMEIKNKIISIRRSQKELSLSQLVKAIKPENMHGEIDFGTRQGNEAW
jgi:antitoxin MazE